MTRSPQASSHVPGGGLEGDAISHLYAMPEWQIEAHSQPMLLSQCRTVDNAALTGHLAGIH